MVLKTNILFVCPCNSLLGPLAESFLNARAGGWVRAFSAGVATSDRINPHVRKLLSAEGLSAEGLAPKSVDVFLMPYATVPDRIIYLAPVPQIKAPLFWKSTTSSHLWSVAQELPVEQSFAAGARYFKRIKQAVEGLVGPVGANVA